MSSQFSRRSVARAVAHAVMGTSMGVAVTQPGFAQSDARPFGDASNRGEMEEVLVTDRRAERYRVDQSSLSKLTESLQNTPQTITTLSRELLAGKETSAPTFGFGTGAPGTNLLSPARNEAFSASGTALRLAADTVGDSTAIYALDTMTLSERWQLIAGLRWDRFAADYEATRFSTGGAVTGIETIDRVDEEASYRAAVVYKPRTEGTVYLSWGTSFNPSAEGLSFITSGRGLGISNAFLAPEENESIEIGAKWNVLDESVTVNGAVFRITKSNARMPDPANPGFKMLGGKERVDGFALNVVGRLADRWQVTAGYAYLDSTVVTSAAGGAPVGSALAHAPEHSLSVWASYRLSDRFDLGAGGRYVDGRLAQNVPPVKLAEDYRTFDAMARYRMSEKITLKLNLTNVTDEYYFDQLHPWHVVPGAGFTAMFAVNVTS